MTSDRGPGPGETSTDDRWVAPFPPYTSREFSDFLEARGVSLLDVVPGAVWGTRRLLVGDRSTGVVQYAAAVCPPSLGTGAIEREELVVTHVRDGLGADLKATLPEFVKHVEVFTNFTSLVVTGVPGLRAPDTASQPSTINLLKAVEAWLVGLWEQTAGERQAVDLGAEAIEVLVDRYASSTQLGPALELLKLARQRLAGLEVAQSLCHGCLCPRHVVSEGDRVLGVDDWGLATPAGDPLRDVGEFAVRVSGARLPETLAGTSPDAAVLREFTRAALSRLGIPPQAWREVLLLSQLELAVKALERGEHDGVVLLARSVAALPRVPRQRNL